MNFQHKSPNQHKKIKPTVNVSATTMTDPLVKENRGIYVAQSSKPAIQVNVNVVINGEMATPSQKLNNAQRFSILQPPLDQIDSI